MSEALSFNITLCKPLDPTKAMGVFLHQSIGETYIGYVSCSAPVFCLKYPCPGLTESRQVLQISAKVIDIKDAASALKKLEEVWL
jgi:hypothetical protein